MRCKAFWKGSSYNYNIVFNYYYSLSFQLAVRFCNTVRFIVMQIKLVVVVVVVVVVCIVFFPLNLYYTMFLSSGISCGRPPWVSNAVALYQSTNFGDVVTYVCNHGYTLFGASQRNCQANGKWGGVGPNCRKY